MEEEEEEEEASAPKMPKAADKGSSVLSERDRLREKNFSIDVDSLEPLDDSAAPDNWKEIVSKLQEYRYENAATVDDFHAFLVGLQSDGVSTPHFTALVACILSVQCRDEVALRAMQTLKDRSPGGDVNVDFIYEAPLDDIEDCVRQCNFYKTKAKHIKECGRLIKERYRSQVPSDANSLKELPGVGPKIAYLVQSVSFGQQDSGIVVDTHAHRVANRLKWCNTKHAEQTRKALEGWVPVDLRIPLPLLLIGLGQNICVTRSPKCGECPISSLCPSAGKISSPS
mmetsp:Transcript_12200/g.29226  ORF Transcript_12200/g.29226 Transcript_12200/m.29226 type:complete len:284 (+) Transcript_12200:3-854(+)